ncbi:MAG: hypothetical protein JNN11_03635 [Candidatus Doudnabacteria bacterium]|nr:hypothetical protein [Candidatus Doudnabacteria bacterium]
MAFTGFVSFLQGTYMSAVATSAVEGTSFEFRLEPGENMVVVGANDSAVEKSKAQLDGRVVFWNVYQAKHVTQLSPNAKFVAVNGRLGDEILSSIEKLVSSKKTGCVMLVVDAASFLHRMVESFQGDKKGVICLSLGGVTKTVGLPKPDAEKLQHTPAPVTVAMADQSGAKRLNQAHEKQPHPALLSPETSVGQPTTEGPKPAVMSRPRLEDVLAGLSSIYDRHMGSKRDVIREIRSMGFNRSSISDASLYGRIKTLEKSRGIQLRMPRSVKGAKPSTPTIEQVLAQSASAAFAEAVTAAKKATADSQQAMENLLAQVTHLLQENENLRSLLQAKEKETEGLREKVETARRLFQQ